MSRIYKAWAVLTGRLLAVERDIDRIFDRLQYAAQLVELPMALIDDIKALGTAVTAARAADVAALAAAQTQITDLTNQIAAADAAVNAQVAALTPTPDDAPAPQQTV